MTKALAPLALVIVSLAAPAFGLTHTAVTREKALEVVSALQKPTNPVGAMLKSSMTSGKKSQLKIDFRTIEVTQIAPDRYTAHLNLVSQDEFGEGADVIVNEVEVLNGQAYVFGFQVERLAHMVPYPGVILGNR
jgi:hypothetical protein